MTEMCEVGDKRGRDGLIWIRWLAGGRDGVCLIWRGLTELAWSAVHNAVQPSTSNHTLPCCPNHKRAIPLHTFTNSCVRSVKCQPLRPCDACMLIRLMLLVRCLRFVQLLHDCGICIPLLTL